MGRNGPHTWVLGVLVPMLGPIVTGVTPTYLPTALTLPHFYCEIPCWLTLRLARQLAEHARVHLRRCPWS